MQEQLVTLRGESNQLITTSPSGLGEGEEERWTTTLRGAGLPQAARCMGLRLAAASRRAGLLARARGACCFCAVWRGAVSGRWRCVLAALSRFRGPSARSRWDLSTDGASPVSLGLEKDAYGAMLAITVEEEDGSSSCAREKKPRINYAPQHTHNLRRYIITT